MWFYLQTGFIREPDSWIKNSPTISPFVQDAYMEEEGPRGDMTIQSRLSNSTESIDSMKALTAAIEAANAQVSFSLLYL